MQWDDAVKVFSAAVASAVSPRNEGTFHLLTRVALTGRFVQSRARE
ncbi:hypothetical protein FJY63_09775 [Candidatus Sumerlaeota bacterium]|nr:hypothetical protein [Candidatus Sumerlaeota bacterium]